MQRAHITPQSIALGLLAAAFYRSSVERPEKIKKNIGELGLGSHLKVASTLSVGVAIYSKSI